MKRLIAGLSMATLLVAGFGARAADSGTLTDPAGAVEWAGSIDAPAAPGDPIQCSLPVEGLCDHFSFTLALPAGYWATHPGSVEFAIRWDERDSTERDLDLFVVDAGGNTVARSTGQDSEAEVAFAHQLPNGSYDVYVAGVSSADGVIDYEGRIEIEPDAVMDQPGSGHDLLPDLVSIPTKTVMMATAEYLVSPVHNPAVSCYPEEATDTGKNTNGVAIRCLRFDQIVANLGAGTMEVRFNPTDDPIRPAMVQRVYSSDGSFRDRFAGWGEFHPIHAHWHYTGFGYAELRKGDDVVVRGAKRGFCMIDVEFLKWAQKGNDPRTTSFPGCQTPNDSGTVVEGIGRGWADNYNWFLADQYLDVTGVPDGVYELKVFANPAGGTTDGAAAIQESDVSNNTSSVWVCMRGVSVALVAGPLAPC